MTTYEDTLARDSFLVQIKRDNDLSGDDPQLMVSLHNIEFTKRIEGYFEVASDVFFSKLIYLLYIKRVGATEDFEKAKEKAKSILINELEEKKYNLLEKTASQPRESFDHGKMVKKLLLLNSAISILERERTDMLFNRYENFESQ